uniref:Major facilitator superfamily (MFS) profile domain-containing protein n=1 Tax=Caenorhabditis japonica TaxID=281687 RepID=A0A8R1DYC6_CAEJA
MVLSIPVGFLACWWIDKYGLCSAYHIGTWANFLGNVVRLVASGSFVHETARFPIALAGQATAAFAQPFVMFLPTKLAAYWFADNERAIANTLSSMSNPIGIAVMYSIAPVFVNKNTPENFFQMNIAVTAVAAIPVALSIFINKSQPPTPATPSKAENVKTPSFLQGVKLCFKSKTFTVLAFCLGGGVGLFNALYNNLQPALCVKGYNQTFNGGMGTLLITSGLVGSAISGLIVDKWGQFEKVMKVSFCLAGIAAASLTVCINYENVEWWVIISICAFGAFGFSIYPIGLEMGVEATFPVAEATSTGLIIMLGQIQGVIYVVITNLAVGKPNPHDLAVQTCVDYNDQLSTVLTWKWPFIIWLSCISILIILFVAFFWPKYKRRNYEQGKITEDCTF